jgi:hypothetical protein
MDCVVYTIYEMTRDRTEQYSSISFAYEHGLRRVFLSPTTASTLSEILSIYEELCECIPRIFIVILKGYEPIARAIELVIGARV